LIVEMIPCIYWWIYSMEGKPRWGTCG